MLTHFFSGATFPAGPGCFFLLRPRADAHSLTAGLGGDASRRGGGFLFAAAPPGPGWCFFLLWPSPDAHSFTVGWGDFGPARPSPARPGTGGVFFFLLRPRRTRRANNKNVWCTTSGLKNPAGPQQKKKTLPRNPYRSLKGPL